MDLLERVLSAASGIDGNWARYDQAHRRIVDSLSLFAMIMADETRPMHSLSPDPQPHRFGTRRAAGLHDYNLVPVILRIHQSDNRSCKICEAVDRPTRLHFW